VPDSLLWPTDQVADAVGDALAKAEADLRLEQAVYGLDAMKEVPLQTVLADGLVAGGTCGVTREAHYPSDLAKKKPGRRRCDLVLTPPGRTLLQADDVDLFTPADACRPQEALWVEVKVAHQFAEGGRRHAGYGPQWREATVKDLRKMEDESAVHEAALLLVVFTADEATVAKDLELFEDVLARKEVLAGFRQVRTVEILERNGHTRCTAALWPTVQRGGA
jgi:hypothetical protein